MFVKQLKNIPVIKFPNAVSHEGIQSKLKYCDIAVVSSREQTPNNAAVQHIVNKAPKRELAVIPRSESPRKGKKELKIQKPASYSPSTISSPDDEFIPKENATADLPQSPTRKPMRRQLKRGRNNDILPPSNQKKQRMQKTDSLHKIGRKNNFSKLQTKKQNGTKHVTKMEHEHHFNDSLVGIGSPRKDADKTLTKEGDSGIRSKQSKARMRKSETVSPLQTSPVPSVSIHSKRKYGSARPVGTLPETLALMSYSPKKIRKQLKKQHSNDSPKLREKISPMDNNCENSVGANMTNNPILQSGVPIKQSRHLAKKGESVDDLSSECKREVNDIDKEAIESCDESIQSLGNDGDHLDMDIGWASDNPIDTIATNLTKQKLLLTGKKQSTMTSNTVPVDIDSLQNDESGAEVFEQTLSAEKIIEGKVAKVNTSPDTVEHSAAVYKHASCYSIEKSSKVEHPEHSTLVSHHSWRKSSMLGCDKVHEELTQKTQISINMKPQKPKCSIQLKSATCDDQIQFKTNNALVSTHLPCEDLISSVIQAHSQDLQQLRLDATSKTSCSQGDGEEFDENFATNHSMFCSHQTDLQRENVSIPNDSDEELIASSTNSSGHDEENIVSALLAEVVHMQKERANRKRSKLLQNVSNNARIQVNAFLDQWTQMTQRNCDELQRTVTAQLEPLCLQADQICNELGEDALRFSQKDEEISIKVKSFETSLTNLKKERSSYDHEYKDDCENLKIKLENFKVRALDTANKTLSMYKDMKGKSSKHHNKELLKALREI